MSKLPGNTDQPANEPTTEPAQGCPPAEFFLEPDIVVVTPFVSDAAGRSAAKGGSAKGGGRKVAFQSGSSIRQIRKKKEPKKRLKKRISVKQW